MKIITRVKEKTRSGLSIVRTKITRTIDARPLVSFFVFLILLIALIVASNIARKPPEEKQKAKAEAKQVSVYQIGSAPKVMLQAQTEKSGVIQIVAQSSGIVQNIYHKEGESVKRGQWLVGLSTNYQGGNALSTQRAIAQKQLKNTEETLPVQKEIIAKQRELAEKSDTNADELRKITAQSVDETKNAIGLNDDILSILGRNLQNYEATNSAGQNEMLILSTKQLRSQYVGANNQLRSALRNSEYSSSDDKPPAQLSNITKDITIKQLELQEKSLELGKEISKLQVQLAYINESLMYPASPFEATVQRVHVRVGQAVTPGTPIATINCVHGGDLRAIVLAPKDVVDKVSQLEPSTLYLGTTTYLSHPAFVSREATHGDLYSIIYSIPQEYNAYLTDKSYVKVEVPVGYFDTGNVIPFIPLDSVYQTEDSSYIFVMNKNKVESRKVVLGEVYGRYVEVKSGIQNGDQVILDRTVVTGDLVTVANK